MLGTKSEDLDQTLANPTDEVAAVVPLIDTAGRALLSQSAELPPDARSLVLSGLVSVIDEAPLANRFRAIVTESPPISTADKPLALIQAIALDALPALIAEEGRQDAVEPWRSVAFSGAVVHNHPLASSFVETVMEDAELSALFPGKDDTGAPSGSHSYASGSGGGEQAATFAWTLIRAARKRSRSDSPGALLDALSELVATARQLGRESAIDATVITGFRGLELPADVQVMLPWGTLRPPKAADFSLDFGFGSADNISVDSVLEATRRISVVIDEAFSEPNERWTRDVGEWHSASAVVRTKVSLTLLLALERDPPLAVVWAAEYVERPLASGDSLSWQDRTVARGRTGLEDGDVGKILETARLVEDHYSPAIEIAVTRTLRSLGERADPIDGLIDAVIALESLFSAGQGELKLRISASVAWLLHPSDQARRKATYDEVKSLYNSRSDVLHGRHLLPQEAAPRHMRAATIAVEVLRKLFTSRPDLIADKRRAETLLVVDSRLAADADNPGDGAFSSRA